MGPELVHGIRKVIYMMFDFELQRITNFVPAESKEVAILLCTMECLSENPGLKITQLKDELLKKKHFSTNSSDIKEKSRSGIEHYYYCAKMYIRLYEALVNKDFVYNYWEEKDYLTLLSSGIILCDKAYEILRLRSNERFLLIMKKAAGFIAKSSTGNIKSKLNSFLDYELEKLDVTEFIPQKSRSHDGTRDKIGMKFLRDDLGCEFVTSEAILEKKNTDIGKSGLRLDVYGWRSDSTIIGIEVKNKLSDFDGTLFNERFGRYLDYCTEFYILCTNETVFKAAKRWCKEHNGAAALYYDGNESYTLLRSPMLSPKRKTTEKMIAKAQEIMVAKMRKLIGEAYMNESIVTPLLAVQEIRESLSKNLISTNI